MNFRWPVQKALYRAAALISIAAYFCGAARVVPSLLALGAQLEGSHIVRIIPAQNSMTVVLAHFQTQASRGWSASENWGGKSSHRHGTAAWALCVLSSAGSTDHVASFSGASHLGKMRESNIRHASNLLTDSTFAKSWREPAIFTRFVNLLPPLPGMIRCGDPLLLRSTLLLV